MKHECNESLVCQCPEFALEPADNCPLHGYPYPPRCAECGRFMRSKPAETFDPRDIAILGGDPSL